ncbi:MAG: DUF4832 domain-containing protein [Candidatus Melainabacteria bacterium]|nr:DUF4832 domain-containing protein [Candidatus Melainabacteria bacterium]
MLRKRTVILASLSLLAFSGSGLSRPAEAKKNKAVELLKYFNPVPDKSYTNESQDRVIKKRKFKPVEVSGARPIDNQELGYFAIIPLEKIDDRQSIEDLLARKEINGISVLLPWASLEPREGEYDFKRIDELLELVGKQKKTVILRISTCGLDNSKECDTPEWALADVKTMEYTATDGKKHKMPIFWDSTYLARWSNFIQALGEKYDGNQSLHSIGITGGGVLGSTRVVPNFVTFAGDTTSGDAEDDGDDEDQNKDQNKDQDKKAESGESKSDKSVAEAESAKTEEAESKAEETADAEEDSHEDSAGVIAKPSRKNYRRLAGKLKKEFGMSERQLVEHWKYVADIFPKAFTKTRLNFDINAPITGKKGQTGLDEISDYLVYRYGQRIYLTRQNVRDGKHGFNEYRILLKFHPDTLTGYQLRPDFKMDDLDKLVKNATQDGISFCELPIELVQSNDEALKTALAEIRGHMGYQLISQAVTIPKEVKVGEPIQASFNFVNLGAAGALNPDRQLDKDLAGSFKIQVELRNQDGKPVVRSLHTPEVPTNEWSAGEPITWSEDLKMPELKPGRYDLYMSLVDTDEDNKVARKLSFLTKVKDGELEESVDAPIGSVEVLN